VEQVEHVALLSGVVGAEVEVGALTLPGDPSSLSAPQAATAASPSLLAKVRTCSA